MKFICAFFCAFFVFAALVRTDTPAHFAEAFLWGSAAFQALLCIIGAIGERK